jgi:hypothetical protein
MATRFQTKVEAEAAIERFDIPCAGAVAIVPTIAKFMKLQPGWYIGFPLNISKRLVDISDYGVA